MRGAAGLSALWRSGLSVRGVCGVPSWVAKLLGRGHCHAHLPVDGLRQVSFDTSHFSGISTMRCGLSTAIETGVPKRILWMQSRHAQDVAAKLYVKISSPALLYETWAAFDL